MKVARGQQWTRLSTVSLFQKGIYARTPKLAGFKGDFLG